MTSSGGTVFANGDLVMPGSVLENFSIEFEAAAEHINGISDVTFTLSDGSNPDVVKTASSETLSNYTPKHFPNSTGCYAASFSAADLQSLNDAKVTLTVKADPTSGTSTSESWTFYNNASGGKQWTQSARLGLQVLRLIGEASTRSSR